MNSDRTSDDGGDESSCMMVIITIIMIIIVIITIIMLRGSPRTREYDLLAITTGTSVEVSRCPGS